MCDDLFSLTLCKKLLKIPPKNCFNSHDGWEKTLYLGIAAEGYQQNTELSRCIFQISKVYSPSPQQHDTPQPKWKLLIPPAKRLFWNLYPPPKLVDGCEGGVDAMKSPEWLDFFNFIFCKAIHHHNCLEVKLVTIEYSSN